MYTPSKKTLLLTAGFVAVAGVYTYWDDVAFAVSEWVHPEFNNGEARLTDDNGTRYTLLNHGDGKESALYDDDKWVTFHRDKDDNLVWDAGYAGLIPTMAAGYYLFHGYSAPVARMDARTMTYRLQSPLQRYEEPQQATATSSTGPRYIGSYWGRRFAKDGYTMERSKRSSDIGTKSGFGNAGVRSTNSYGG